MPFNIGLSGLNAAAADLKVTGNNIANAATIGFKESRAEFADVFAQSYGHINRTAIGSGVRLAATPQQFSQGSLEYSDNSLDLAINGDGFFVLNDNGSKVYSRAGAYQVNRDGYIVNAAGQRLQTYPPKLTGSTDPNFNVGMLNDLQLPTADQTPLATTEINAQLNLRADALPPVDPATGSPYTAIDLSNPDTYNYSTAVTVYDSMGTPRTMTMYFVKPGTGGPLPTTPVVADPLNWTVYAEMDGMTPPPPSPVTPTAGPFTLTFDSNGNLPVPSPVIAPEFDLTQYSPMNPGATIGPLDPTTATLGSPDGLGTNPGVIEFDFTGTTQKTTTYSVNDLSQDGYTTGRLSGLDVDQSGVMFARYSNGRSEILGQVAMADFENPQGLIQLGDNNWAASYGSGEPVYDSPNNGKLGAVQSGALEASNVDTTEELVNLITAQRNYQANAKTISTADQMTQTILNLQ